MARQVINRLSPGALLIAGAAVPAAAFGVLYETSRRFRSFVRNRDPRSLSLVQTPRIIGAAIFARQYANGAIPARYGVTVALLDLAAGVTAPLIVRFASTRMLTIWNWLGLGALLVSAGSGVITSPTRWEKVTRQKTSQPTNSFPLVLVPTIFGPATLLAHIMALTVLHRNKVIP